MKPNEAAKSIWDEFTARVRRPRERELLDNGWQTVAGFAKMVDLGPSAAAENLWKLYQAGDMDRTSGLVDIGGGRVRVASFYRPKALRPAETGASKARVQ